MRHTKIVCTLGPASSSRETVAAMVRAGMDVARLNTSHGTIDEHVRLVALVREVAAEEGRPIGVLMDLGGPKIRTGDVAGGEPVALEAGQAVQLSQDALESTAVRIAVRYPRLTQDIHAGERVLLDDGRLELEVVAVTPAGLDCRVLVGGLLGAHKGVTFPHSTLTVPALTERDREAARAGVAARVDYFALSFVRRASDLQEARDLVTSLGGDMPIIAKIERRQAVEDLAAVLRAADGAMVARGDLGVELPPEDVPIRQREIIAAAAREMIPVITATQMLESMVASPRPTRAEASDVANAVWERSDAVMLSGETAIGRYPVESVAMMDRIIRRAETAMEPEHPSSVEGHSDDHGHVVAIAARRIVESDPNMRAVVCFTRSGKTAILLSKVHPSAPVFAMTHNEPVWRRLTLARSVTPLLVPAMHSVEEMLAAVDRALLQGRLLERGDEMVVVASLPVEAKSDTNFLKLHHLGEATP